jgi:hypothetical protein
VRRAKISANNDTKEPYEANGSVTENVTSVTSRFMRIWMQTALRSEVKWGSLEIQIVTIINANNSRITSCTQ